MLMDAVLAVALGLVPVEGSGPAVRVHVGETQMVTNYKQRADRKGNLHLSGYHPKTGERYQFTVSKAGYVDGQVGDRVVTFHAAGAS